MAHVGQAADSDVGHEAIDSSLTCEKAVFRPNMGEWTARRERRARHARRGIGRTL